MNSSGSNFLRPLFGRIVLFPQPFIIHHIPGAPHTAQAPSAPEKDGEKWPPGLMLKNRVRSADFDIQKSWKDRPGDLGMFDELNIVESSRDIQICSRIPEEDDGSEKC